MQPTFISLESIQIATPCRADWNAMQKVQGSDCTRFCPSCGKNVYDLSGMTREEAVRLIEEKEGKLCARLRRRSDGTVITNDCPVGKSASRKRSRMAQCLAAIVGVGTAIWGTCSVLANRASEESKPTITQEFTMGVVSAIEVRPTPTQEQIFSSFPKPTE